MRCLRNLWAATPANHRGADGNLRPWRCGGWRNRRPRRRATKSKLASHACVYPHSTLLCCQLCYGAELLLTTMSQKKIKPWVCVSRFNLEFDFFWTDGYFCCSKRTHRHRTAASIGSQSIQLMYRATLCIYFISSCTTQVAGAVHELMTETTCDLACFHGNNAARWLPAIDDCLAKYLGEYKWTATQCMEPARGPHPASLELWCDRSSRHQTKSLLNHDQNHTTEQLG